MQILVATTNRHKLREIEDVLSDPALTLLSLAEMENAPEVVEDGDTFEANASRKAIQLAKYSGMWTIADDSGLEVAALGNAPGVHSARYAGEPVDYKANNRKLLKSLENSTQRSARFVCVIALSDPDGCCRTVRGTVEGSIGFAEKGDEGFGYDPLFIPEGHSRTFAEMTGEEKNEISHRGNALSLAVQEWAGLLKLDMQDGSQDNVEYVKICELRDELLAKRVGEELTDKGIPHVVRTYRDSAYDGIFQTTLGWGHLEGPADRQSEILDIVAALEMEDQS